MQPECGHEDITKRFSELFSEQIRKENELERDPLDGSLWRTKNKASKEAGQKILSALLIDVSFVERATFRLDSQSSYEREAQLLKRALKPEFYRQVFKVYSKRLLGEQLRLHDFLRGEVLKRDSEDSSILAQRQPVVRIEELSSIANCSGSFDNSFALQFLVDLRDEGHNRTQNIRVIENGEVKQEIDELVEDTSYVAQPKSALGMLESKVKPLNPEYNKVSNVDQRITVTCQYDFGPNKYTDQRIRFIEKGVDIGIKNAQKKAAAAVLKVLFSMFPSAWEQIKQQSSIAKKDSKA